MRVVFETNIFVSELVKKSAALGISCSGGTRNPHVFQYTLRFLRSGGTRPPFARDDFFTSSAFVLPGSRAGAALLRVVEGKDHLIVYKSIIDELLAVLARKFNRHREELARLAVFLAEIAELVHPERKIACGMA